MEYHITHNKNLTMYQLHLYLNNCLSMIGDLDQQECIFVGDYDKWSNFYKSEFPNDANKINLIISNFNRSGYITVKEYQTLVSLKLATENQKSKFYGEYRNISQLYYIKYTVILAFIQRNIQLKSNAVRIDITKND
jgi:hypothetical protein